MLRLCLFFKHKLLFRSSPFYDRKTNLQRLKSKAMHRKEIFEHLPNQKFGFPNKNNYCAFFLFSFCSYHEAQELDWLFGKNPLNGWKKRKMFGKLKRKMFLKSSLLRFWRANVPSYRAQPANIFNATEEQPVCSKNLRQKFGKQLWFLRYPFVNIICFNNVRQELFISFDLR